MFYRDLYGNERFEWVKKKKKQGKKKIKNINRNVSHFFKRGHKFSVKIILAKPQTEMSERGVEEGWVAGGWRVQRENS